MSSLRELATPTTLPLIALTLTILAIATTYALLPSKATKQEPVQEPVQEQQHCKDTPTKPMSLRLRKITSVVKGSTHGPITRLVSPGTKTGDQLRPFVFLDFLNHASLPKGFGFGMHPHSGIATVTYQLNQDVEYVDTEGRAGLLKRRGVEWMKAGGGAWHRASFPIGGPAIGFQLWVPLPPGMEDGPSDSEYFAPETIPKVGGVSVLMGEHQGLKSPVTTPYEINYFDVELQPEEKVVVEIPETHNVAFAFVYDGGSASVNGTESFRQLLTFEEEGDAIELQGKAQPSRVLVGSAPRFPFDNIPSGGSVHTNPESMKRAQAKIQQLGKKLEEEGRMF